MSKHATLLLQSAQVDQNHNNQTGGASALCGRYFSVCLVGGQSQQSPLSHSVGKSKCKQVSKHRVTLQRPSSGAHHGQSAATFTSIVREVSSSIVLQSMVLYKPQTLSYRENSSTYIHYWNLIRGRGRRFSVALT